MKIKDDSRKVTVGDTFIALKKINDGHLYVEDAIKNGATSVIVERGMYDVETVVVPDTHDYLVNYLKVMYYDQIKDLKLIGMTGTNGKTTTCFLIYQALNKLGLKCAYIGTIGFYIEDKIRNLSNTTPDILEIYELLLECKKQGCEYVVMETSSHALDMDRLAGLKFEIGIFSNLTMDHLDYHGSLENYSRAKQKLFDMTTEKTIVNADDPHKDDFLRDNTITYGINDGNIKITNYSVDIIGSTFKIAGIKYKSNLIGKHNLYNILVVITLLKYFEINDNKIKKIISSLIAPPGRMDMIKNNSNAIIVDYAHTPDAVEKIILAVKELKPNKIITLIGCGGDRDKAKRPIMTKIATDLSDYVILTSDNPRTESPELIINDMLHELDNSNYEIEINREKAIIKGIQLLQKNDILLVLGKGHETYQVIGKQKINFDDKKVVLDNI